MIGCLGNVTSHDLGALLSGEITQFPKNRKFHDNFAYFSRKSQSDQKIQTPHK